MDNFPTNERKRDDQQVELQDSRRHAMIRPALIALLIIATLTGLWALATHRRTPDERTDP